MEIKSYICARKRNCQYMVWFSVSGVPCMQPLRIRFKNVKGSGEWNQWIVNRY